MALQAFFNEKRTGIKLDDFFDFADLFIRDDVIKEIMKEIKTMR